MSKASPRSPSSRKKPVNRKAAFQRKVAAMVKGGRAIAKQQASDKIAKKANARSIAKVGHRMVGTASARVSRVSPIAAQRAAKLGGSVAAAKSAKRIRVTEKLAGRKGRQLDRAQRKLRSKSIRIAAPPVNAAAKQALKRPVPLGRLGPSSSPGLKTNLLKSRGTLATASIGAKLRARKLGRNLKASASSAFHAPENLSSAVGRKVASSLAGKRLTARLKG